jgi:hypothetical protein
MTDVVFVSLWAHLFCGPWSEPGKVFGWLRAFAHKRLPEWAFSPSIGCSACHAVWAGAAVQAWRLANWQDIGLGNLLAVLAGSWGAILLDDFARLRDKEINK